MYITLYHKGSGNAYSDNMSNGDVERDYKLNLDIATHMRPLESRFWGIEGCNKALLKKSVSVRTIHGMNL